MNLCRFCNRKISKVNPTGHKCRTGQSHKVFGTFDSEIREMILNGYSLLMISNMSLSKFGVHIPRHYIGMACNWLEVTAPSTKTVANSVHTRGQYSSTINELYGVNNISQSTIVKDKKKSMNLERYGVENQFQRDLIKEKSKQTLISKYGVNHPIHIPGRKPSNGRLSKPHKKVSDFLNSIRVEHSNDEPGLFLKSKHSNGRIYGPIPDIFIKNKKLVIEIYGNRWHMNPAIYSETDVVRLYTGLASASQIWERDAERIAHIKSFGVEVLILWEEDIKHNFDAVKHRINGALCKN